MLKNLRNVTKRFLDLYEAHAKELLTQYKIPHQRGYPARTVEEALEMAEKVKENFGAKNVVVKAHVLAGGRGKGHFDTGFKKGVHFCTNMDKVKDATKNMLGNKLITIQTPPGGIKVKSVFVAEGLDFERELYFAMLLDRNSGGPVIITSTEGGVEIEETAKKNPEKILKCTINVDNGPNVEELAKLASSLGFTKEEHQNQFVNLASNCYKCMMEKDLLQIEVNPLVFSEKEGIKCLDAKLNIDENSLFRHKDIDAKKDLSELNEMEIKAKKFGFEYIKLDGSIGCLVNGAGLAMATCDIIQLYGSMPANFLDVGGGATKKQVEEAFKIITSDPNVKAILVNIFGGIMKCDIIAEGIIAALKVVKLNVPLIVRLSGTNSEKGKKLLEDSKLPIITAHDLDEAAQKSCEAIGIKKI